MIKFIPLFIIILGSYRTYSSTFLGTDLFSSEKILQLKTDFPQASAEIGRCVDSYGFPYKVNDGSIVLNEEEFKAKSSYVPKGIEGISLLKLIKEGRYDDAYLKLANRNLQTDISKMVNETDEDQNTAFIILFGDKNESRSKDNLINLVLGKTSYNPKFTQESQIKTANLVDCFKVATGYSPEKVDAVSAYLNVYRWDWLNNEGKNIYSNAAPSSQGPLGEELQREFLEFPKKSYVLELESLAKDRSAYEAQKAMLSNPKEMRGELKKYIALEAEGGRDSSYARQERTKWYRRFKTIIDYDQSNEDAAKKFVDYLKKAITQVAIRKSQSVESLSINDVKEVINEAFKSLGDYVGAEQKEKMKNEFFATLNGDMKNLGTSVSRLEKSLSQNYEKTRKENERLVYTNCADRMW